MSGKRVMVIDDDENHLIVTKELLVNEGYEVLTHQHGFGVTSAVTSLKPDLVLLDINMPGLSGDQLISILMDNGNTKHATIVFYSSNDVDSLRESVSKYGAKGYICKGDIPELRRKIRHYLNLTNNNS